MSEQGWQPIKTAPKDGTQILIAYEAARDTRVTIARWHGHFWPDGKREGWQADVGYVPATHWMELPAPPKVD